MESCELKRIGNLPFKQNLHAKIYCGVFKFPRTDEKALVCRHRQCVM